MKVRKFVSLFLAFTLIALLTAGCGSASYDKSYNAAAPMAPSAMAESAYDYEISESAGSGSSQLSLPSGRKWIVTVNMDAETEDLDGLLTAVNQKINQLGGYVQNQNIHNGSAYSTSRYRRASLTVRIPVENLSAFTGEVQSLSNVVSNNQSASDVTLNYVDTESRIAALKVEEERLLDLMGQADNMADLLEIESRLTDVRYELERYGSNLRVLDNQIDFATIYLDIEEVQQYTPVAERSYWEKISDGFVNSLRGLWKLLQNLSILLIVCLPYLVVLGLIAWAIVAICKVSSRKKKAGHKNRTIPENVPWNAPAQESGQEDKKE